MNNATTTTKGPFAPGPQQKVKANGNDQARQDTPPKLNFFILENRGEFQGYNVGIKFGIARNGVSSFSSFWWWLLWLLLGPRGLKMSALRQGQDLMMRQGHSGSWIAQSGMPNIHHDRHGGRGIIRLVRLIVGRRVGSTVMVVKFQGQQSGSFVIDGNVQNARLVSFAIFDVSNGIVHGRAAKQVHPFPRIGNGRRGHDGGIGRVLIGIVRIIGSTGILWFVVFAVGILNSRNGGTVQFRGQIDNAMRLFPFHGRGIKDSQGRSWWRRGVPFHGTLMGIVHHEFLLFVPGFVLILIVVFDSGMEWIQGSINGKGQLSHFIKGHPGHTSLGFPPNDADAIQGIGPKSHNARHSIDMGIVRLIEIVVFIHAQIIGRQVIDPTLNAKPQFVIVVVVVSFVIIFIGTIADAQSHMIAIANGAKGFHGKLDRIHAVQAQGVVADGLIPHVRPIPLIGLF